MEVLISHQSALQYWRTYSKAQGIAYGKPRGANVKAQEAHTYYQRARKAPATPPKASVLLKGNLFGLSFPIDITVSTANSRRTSTVFRSHVSPKALPNRGLVNIRDGFLVASPELCFFQMAGELSLPKLIELGYELCGSYSLSTNITVGEDIRVESAATYNLKPLTNTKKLRAFVDQMAGRQGVKQAVKALQYIVDGSGSPMESILAILLVLPFRLGGYGFPLPEMNRRVDPKATGSTNPNKRFYKCDLLWKDFTLAAEYDSSLHHANQKSISDDSIRRGDLALSGVDVVTVTDKQVYQVEAFDKVARQLALKMGRRVQIRNSKFIVRRHELRGMLL